MMRHWRGVGAEPAEAAFAAMKFLDRGAELVAIEIGPHRVREYQFRVSAIRTSSFVPVAVARSTRRISVRKRAGRRSRRPITERRAPLSMNRRASERRYALSSHINSFTSSGGRRQLSHEKAKSVRVVIPRSGAASIARRTAFAPARWPAGRGKPRRVAQRPLPSMIIARCMPALDCKVLCIIKFLPKKNLSGRREPRRQTPHRFVLAGRGRVTHNLLQHLDVFEIAAAPEGRDPAHRLWPVVVETLRDLHHPRFLQNLQMPAQVAVAQRAQLLQVVETQPLGMRDQRSENAEARPLVDQSIQPFVREAALAPLFLFRTANLRSIHSIAEQPHRAVVRIRMAEPSAMATACAARAKMPGTQARLADTSRRQHTWLAAESAPTRKRRR